MRILIVECEPMVRQVLSGALRREPDVTMVYEAGNLDDALGLIDEVDGVLCEGAFPTHAGRATEPRETQSGNWAPVMLRCRRARKVFVLYTSNTGLVDALRQRDHAAYQKPLEGLAACRALVEEIRSDAEQKPVGAGLVPALDTHQKPESQKEYPVIGEKA